MEVLKNISSDALVKLIADFIKECSDKMGNNTNMELDIDYSNWQYGNKKWAYTKIRFGNNSCEFNEKEITEGQFVAILEKALNESGVKGKVFYDEYGDGYWSKKVVVFNRIAILAKPCKEFNELNKMLKKYGSSEIGEYDIYSVSVCGKRSSHSDCGDYRYLCHNSNLCLKIIDDIKNNRQRGWKLSVETEGYLEHGDEEGYRVAMYQESEWYGKRGVSLSVVYYNSKAKRMFNKEYRA